MPDNNAWNDDRDQEERVEVAAVLHVDGEESRQVIVELPAGQVERCGAEVVV